MSKMIYNQNKLRGQQGQENEKNNLIIILHFVNKVLHEVNR